MLAERPQPPLADAMRWQSGSSMRQSWPGERGIPAPVQLAVLEIDRVDFGRAARRQQRGNGYVRTKTLAVKVPHAAPRLRCSEVSRERPLTFAAEYRRSVQEPVCFQTCVTCRMLCRICSFSTTWASSATRTSTSSNSSLPPDDTRTDAAFPQQIDEVLEQAAIEEFRRIEAVEHRHALSHQLAAFFQRGLRDFAAAGFHQQRHREVIALDGLNRGLRQQRKLHGLRRARRRATPRRAIFRGLE